jgi:hypothetical protein
MPLELGMDLGCQKFGRAHHRKKVLLVFDKERYRYQKFISDLAGQDVVAHNDNPKTIITKIRDWLSSATGGTSRIPGGDYIYKQYQRFCHDLPALQDELKFDADMSFPDYLTLIRFWVDEVEA